MSDEPKPCTRCGGTGSIDVDDLNCIPCECLAVKLFRKHLGLEIAGAKPIKASPLYIPVDGAAPRVDLTKASLFVQVWWRDFISHLKYVFIFKGMDFHHRVVSDDKLLAVYLGNENYQARAKSKRDQMETNNTIEDLVGAQYDLVILRIGHLGHKNIAMAGVIKQALLHRETIGKPTWVIEEPDKAYEPWYYIAGTDGPGSFGGNFSYSDDTADYFKRKLKLLNMVREGGFSHVQEEIDTALDEVGVDTDLRDEPVEAKSAVKPKAPRRAVKEEAVAEVDFDLADMDLGALGDDAGESKSKSKKQSKKSWKKPSSGGGPV